MKPSYNQLVDACRMVRIAAQQISDENKISYFPSFPRGWCGCVSRVLGAWLTDSFQDNEFFYICGNRSGSHAWIEYGEIILDITADQFDDCDDAIIVKPNKESMFHRSFEIEDKHICHIEDVNYPEESIIYQRAKKISLSVTQDV